MYKSPPVSPVSRHVGEVAMVIGLGTHPSSFLGAHGRDMVVVVIRVLGEFGKVVTDTKTNSKICLIL